MLALTSLIRKEKTACDLHIYGDTVRARLARIYLIYKGFQGKSIGLTAKIR